MEVSAVTVASPRVRLDHIKEMDSENTQLRNLEVESFDSGDIENDDRFHPTNCLGILRETVRILRYNSWGFMTIAALLICPLSAVVLSNLLVDSSIVNTLSIRLLLVAKSSGLPLRPFVQHSCQKFSEMAIASTMCFPFYVTLSLLSKAAVVYSVAATYSKKKVDFSKFFETIRKIWRRLLLTYLWSCIAIVGSVLFFFVLLIAVCSTVSVIGSSPEFVVYAAMLVGLAFSIAFANVVIICNFAVVIAMLEDVSGLQALLSSGVLIKGQTQVGLLIYLGSTIGTVFIEGLFEHRVKTLSYGDGSSRIWEGPLLVIMYSFVVLVDSMMNVVFFFSCKTYNTEVSQFQALMEDVGIPAGPVGVQ